MKKLNPLILTILFSPVLAFAQIDTVQQEMVSMSDSYGKTIDGKYRYFKNGENQAYSGVLFAKFPNGNYNSIQEFKNGIGDGTWMNFYENGNQKEVGTYQQNKVAGAIQKFYPSGKLKAEGTYREWRIRVGEWIYYDEEGKILKKENYGERGDFRDVEELYKAGDISKSYYEKVKRGE